MNYTDKWLVVVVGGGPWRPSDKRFWRAEFENMLAAPAAGIVISLDSPGLQELVAARVSHLNAVTRLIGVSPSSAVLPGLPTATLAVFTQIVSLNLDTARGNYTAITDGMLLTLARARGKARAGTVTFDRVSGNFERTDRAALLSDIWDVPWQDCITPGAARA